MTEWQGQPDSAADYERLDAAIEALQPRAILGSTTLFDYNKLLVQRRQLWMRQNGLGPL